jgi:hypothetical protein
MATIAAIEQGYHNELITNAEFASLSTPKDVQNRVYETQSSDKNDRLIAQISACMIIITRLRQP